MTTRAELVEAKWQNVQAAFDALSSSRARRDGLGLAAAVGMWLPFADDQDET